MSDNPLNSSDISAMFLELKNLMLEQKIVLDVFLPNEVPLSMIADNLNKSRQTIRAYIISNFEPEVDYQTKNGKIMVSKDAFVKIIGYYNAKRRL